MKTEIFNCDRCKKKYDEEDLAIVQLKVGYIGGGAADYAAMELKQADWCRACLLELGIYRGKMTLDDKKAEPPATLETLIREVVRDEMAQASNE